MQKDTIFISGTDDKSVFCDFCSKNNEIVLKPVNGERGQGVQRILVSDTKGIENAWKAISVQNCEFEVDKVLFNCPEIEVFHPQSLNTIRLSIVLDKSGVPHIMAATLRTGTGVNQVDNGHHEGVYAAINVENGVVITDGFNAKGESFLQHPDSNVQFSGTIIPHWEELITLALKVATIEPSMRYIGWDYVLDQSYHWLLLEGNEPGGIDIHQHPLDKGLYNEYCRYVYGN